MSWPRPARLLFSQQRRSIANQYHCISARIGSPSCSALIALAQSGSVGVCPRCKLSNQTGNKYPRLKRVRRAVVLTIIIGRRCLAAAPVEGSVRFEAPSEPSRRDGVLSHYLWVYCTMRALEL